MKARGKTMKIDIELEKTIREFAQKNNIRLREASRLIAESLKKNKGKKVIKETIIRELDF